MNITQKILTSIVLIVIIVSTIMPTVQAATEEILPNGTQEQILYQQEENNNINETSNIPTNFEVLLAYVLSPNEGASENKFELSEVPSIILQKPAQTGIYVEENSREYFVSFVNKLTNKNYKVNENGFLIEDVENLKAEEECNSSYEIYTSKIDELINSEKTIIISIKENYQQYNKATEEILTINIQDDEYALLFKNAEEKNNTDDIIILNSEKYNNENTDNSSNYLMNKLLEVYYNDDDEFNNSITDTEIVNEVKNQDNLVVENEEQKVEENNTSNEPTNIENKAGDFNRVLAEILHDNNNSSTENIIKPTEPGIWVQESSRTIFLDFLNNHGIYTYSIDENGYLIRDNTMKSNPNLDFIDETELDIEINRILEEDVTLYISITSNYLTSENTVADLLKTEYVKTFDNEEGTARIVLLNNTYFNVNTRYDIELLDRFVKYIFKYNQDISLLSDTSKTGNMTSAQTVYAGPSDSNYATVGSVDPNEQVYILGQQSGWYHIQYHAGSVQKSGFVSKSTLTNLNVPDSNIHEEIMTGGQRYAKQNLSIQSCDDTSISTTLGTVYAGEGLTVLYDYGYSGSNGSYRIAYIEISTSTGTKRGYVYNDQLDNTGYNSSVARVTATSPAYSGPDSSYVKLGGAYYNEFVSILAKDGDWVFVEYNTSSGRKRGYMSYSNLYNYNHPGMYNDLATNHGLKQATQQLTVYGGPNSNNANIGLIYNQEVVSLFGVERGYAYIEYSTTNGAKRGYVLYSALQTANPPSLPSLPTYNGFVSGTYGTSGLGQALKYYKMGSGPNVAFAIFEQHGWEDAWAYDGVELVNIANRVMSNLSASGINNNWTLYVVPYANPDGITNGYTNNGPGRCTVTTKIDMNRCWPANFAPTYTSRNYTGASSLGAPEAVALKNFISNNIGSNQKIILDIHGWLNQTYGDYSVAQYFNNQFGFGHSSSYGSGYLETWGASIGAKSCLIELPFPSSSSDITNRDFSGKLTNGIRNMLGGSGTTEGGTEVIEKVKVISSGNLNVRSGPGTSYSLVTTIPNGATATRIRKNVATANGYVWDKIRMTDGLEGYVATNYLEIVSANEEDYTSPNGLYFSTDSNGLYRIDSNAETNIIEGELDYNSVSITEEERNSEITKRQLGITLAGTAYATFMKDAGNNLLYFLTSGQSKHDNETGAIYSYEDGYYKTGHTAKEVLFENAVDDMNAPKETLNNSINAMIEAAENMIIDDTTNKPIYCYTEINGQCPATNLDWFCAIYNYRTRNNAVVSKSGNSYSMSFKHIMIDYYDWEATEGILNWDPYIGAQTEFSKLNKYGLSRNYTNYDILNYTVTWTKGQKVGSGANVSGPGLK